MRFMSRLNDCTLLLRACSLAIALSDMKKGAAPGGPERHFWEPE